MADENELLESALEHHRSGRFQEAVEGYQQVLRENPEQPDGLYLLGCLAQQTGHHLAACDLLRKAVAAAPEQAEYHHALGLALSSMGDYAGAARSYQRTIELVPEHMGALTALGRTIRLLDKESKDAVEYLHRAFQLTPGDTAVACELADALLDIGQPAQAVLVYHRAIELDTRLAKAWYGCGCAENVREEFVAARDCFARAVELEPEWLEARHNLGRALYELGCVTEAFSHFRQCSEMDVPGSEQSRAMMAVIVPGVPEVDNAGILQTRKVWVDRDLARVAGITRHASGIAPLRVGYVSSFFHRDNWMKPVWGLINQHDRRAVQVYLFSDCAASAIRHGYRADAEDRFFDTSELSNGEIAALVDKCEIDLLVDLNGYSNMRRLPLFARRVAPVMIGWFNMYATTGMSSFDCLIGDAEVVTTEEEQFYSEKVLRVRGSYLTFDVSYPVPPVALPSAGERRGIVFGSLASPYKITDEVIESWCRILRASPESSLLVKNKQMASSSGRDFFAARFWKHGIGGERLQLEGPEEHFEFLRAYERTDVALDTFPYNGGTTTTEAIWQGVPVVTFYGDRWASRTSTSILRAGGLGEFVARDVAGYVELATELGNGAGTLERLMDLRRGMRERLKQSSVCDTGEFAREMERIYAGWCDRAL